MLTLFALFVPFVLSGFLSWRLANARGYWLILDEPNHRSLHTRPTPRTGGIAMLTAAGAGLCTAWIAGNHLPVDRPTGISILTLALVALVDDRHDLGAGLRLLMQMAVVVFLLYSSHYPDWNTMIYTAAFLLLIWMINLYNFMDGMDGFAGGMAVFGFGTFALLAWQAGNLEFALGCAIIVTSCFGFLLLNFPPARLFMGDAGSTVLGLLAGIVILKAHIEAILPLWLGVLVFSPFIVDASVTLASRMLRGERFWLAHKSHYYQRLVESDWGHRKTVLAEYALMAGCCSSAMLAARLPLPGQISIIGGWTVLYVFLMWAIHNYQRTREKQT
jgi:UDP-N-acetylmuramyl pentapeptide phosphotransferase/UDP-N-acetylglucosamine-1-phosphate transferase